jgi:hypothetical protein
MEMARCADEALGREVRHAAVSPAEFREFGFPGADDLGNMFQYNRDFESDFRAPRDVEATRKLNPRLQSFSQCWQQNASQIPLEGALIRLPARAEVHLFRRPAQGRRAAAAGRTASRTAAIVGPAQGTLGAERGAASMATCSGGGPSPRRCAAIARPTVHACSQAAWMPPAVTGETMPAASPVRMAPSRASGHTGPLQGISPARVGPGVRRNGNPPARPTRNRNPSMSGTRTFAGSWRSASPACTPPGFCAIQPM